MNEYFKIILETMYSAIVHSVNMALYKCCILLLLQHSGYLHQYFSVCWCRSSPFLELPEPDLRPEQMILSSDEAMVDLRKRDRDALVRNLAARKKQVGGNM